MRSFEKIALNVAALRRQVEELDGFLGGESSVKEREEISPFFKTRKQLCAALGLTNSSVAMADLVATELDLFGDFVCDAASRRQREVQTARRTLLRWSNSRTPPNIASCPSWNAEKR